MKWCPLEIKWGHCAHKLTAAVVTCIRAVQESASQHSGMDKRESHKVISPGEGLSAIDSCQGREKSYFSQG